MSASITVVLVVNVMIGMSVLACLVRWNAMWMMEHSARGRQAKGACISMLAISLASILSCCLMIARLFDGQEVSGNSVLVFALLTVLQIGMSTFVVVLLCNACSLKGSPMHPGVSRIVILYVSPIVLIVTVLVLCGLYHFATIKSLLPPER